MRRARLLAAVAVAVAISACSVTFERRVAGPRVPTPEEIELVRETFGVSAFPCFDDEELTIERVDGVARAWCSRAVPIPKTGGKR